MLLKGITAEKYGTPPPAIPDDLVGTSEVMGGFLIA
jgi:hypothetical protein